MIAADTDRPELIHRHAMLRQRTVDFIGQGAPGLVLGTKGLVVQTRSGLQEGVSPEGEMPDVAPLSTLIEQTLGDDALKSGIRRMVDAEERSQDGLHPIMHRRPDGDIEPINGVPVTLRPGVFQVAHMGQKDWLFQGGPAFYTRPVFDGGVIDHYDPDFEDPIADVVIKDFAEGWIVALLRGHMELNGQSDLMHIDSLEVIAATHGFETDYANVRDQFGQGAQSITYGMMPIAYVIAPGRRGNAGPVIFGGFCNGSFRLLKPYTDLFKS